MEVLHDILGYKNRKIYQDSEYFSFSLDSIMLANFVTIRKRDKKIVDLCTGNAIIPLIMSLRTTKPILGIELQEKISLLAQKSVSLNHLEQQISILSMDVKDFVTQENIEQYDLVTCNPPYFKINEKNFFKNSLEQTIARHELKLTLEEMIIVVKKILKNGGNFAMVHRSERLLEIFSLFRKNGIEPKRIRFVYENPLKESNLVLIEGQKGGKIGLKIEAPFLLYKENGEKTEEYSQLLVEVKS